MALQPQLIDGILGETLVFTATIKRNNQPVNLTGATIWMTAKDRYTDPDPGVFQVSTGNGDIVVTNAPAGICTIVIGASETAGLRAPLALYYDVKVKEQNGNENVPIFGTLRLLPNVTDAS